MVHGKQRIIVVEGLAEQAMESLISQVRASAKEYGCSEGIALIMLKSSLCSGGDVGIELKRAAP